MIKVNLFCLPYAGASSVIFNPWKNYCSDRINLIPVEYPGRGKRFQDSLINNLDHLVDDIFLQIKHNLNQPYAFFGHSLGGLVCYELCRKISETSHNKPMHVFISGRRSPYVLRSKEQLFHQMSKPELLDELKRMGGVSDTVFNSSELLDLFLPIIRNDFKLAESINTREAFQISSNVSLMVGLEDHIINDFGGLDWTPYTSASVDIKQYNGGHFYLNDCYENMLTYMDQILRDGLS